MARKAGIEVEKVPQAVVEPVPSSEETLPAVGERASGLANPRTRMLLMGFLLLLLVGGTVAWRYYAVRETTDDAQIDGDIYTISARITGHAIKVNVENNDFVKAGTVLVELDPRDYEVALDRALGDLANAKAAAAAASVGVPITSVTMSSQETAAAADVRNAEAAGAAAEKQRQAAEARVAEAEANDVKAQADVQRYAQLVAKLEISQQQYDYAVAAAKATAAALQAASAAAVAAREEVSQARARLAERQAQLRAAQTAPQHVAVSRSRAASAQAAVQSAQAAVAQARLNLGYTKIVAPVDGIVGKKSVEVGENVQPGQALMAVVPINDLYVTANFKETQLKNMRPGQAATIHVDAYGRDYRGHVLNVAGATGERFSLLPPENASGNYVKVVQRMPVRIVFDPGQNTEILRPGMSVEPTVITK
jgi:membrane fusion protein (multidrug efflux system)